MATYYWVGGTGNWDTTTTNWSTTSGGSGGSGPPTSADDVIFDTLSNATAYTVTLLTTPVCRSVTVGGPLTGNVTLAGTANWIIYGSLTFAATGITNSYTGFAGFVATTTGWTVTTNGVAFNGITIFSGAGGGWTLGGAFTSYGGIQLYAGTLTSNNYSITTLNDLNFNVGGASLKTVNLGSSAVSCQFFEAASPASLTLNAGTSTLTVTSSSTTFTGGGQTYYNVSFTATSSPNLIIAGANTFNNLTFATGTVLYSISYINFQANQTINGTLTMSGASYTQRLFVLSSSFNTSITLSVAAVSALSYIDFGSITVAGASAPWSGTSLGDLQNNVNITTTTPKIVYWNYPNAYGNWSPSNGAIAWATSSGGATAVANFPLAQDTCIFDNTGLGTTGTVNYDRNWSLGKLDFSAVTNPATFSMGSYPSFYLDVIFSSSLTLTQTVSTVALFQGYGTQTLTSAGLSFPAGANFGRATTSSLVLSDNASALTWYLGYGALNLNNNTLTAGNNFNSNNANTRSIAFGTGAINLTGNNAELLTVQGPGMTCTGSKNVNLTYAGSVGTRTWFNNVNSPDVSRAFNINITAGTDIVTPTAIGASSVNNLNFTGFKGTYNAYDINLYGDLTLDIGMAPITASGGNMQFIGTGTQNINTNGIALAQAVLFVGTGTYTLIGNVSINTYYTTLNSGTLNLNGRSLTVPNFYTGGASTKSVAFGGGTIVLNGGGGGIIWGASGSNFSTSGSGKISCTAATNKVFNGAGFNYPTISQDGAGILYINGNNTFRTLANTVAPATISMQASSTTSIAGFDLVGTAGNLITLSSFVSGTQATINNTTGGRIGGNYLSYQDMNATPANTISAGANSTSVSNNTGWLTTPVVSVAIAESFSLYVPVTFKANSTFSGAPFGSVPIVGGIDITVINMYDYFQGFRGQFDSVNDAITLSNAQVSQVNFNPTNTESLTLTDAQSTQVSFAPTNAETLTLTNAQSSQVSFVSTNAESITVADSQAGIRGQFATTAEAITFTDTQAALAAFAPQVAELLTLTELISIQSNLVGYTAETIVFTDTQIQRGWTKIINSQTPNWTNINDYQ